MKTPPTFPIVTPQAAAYLFGVSDARLGRLALDGRIPYLMVRSSGRKPCRSYSLAACAERWGEPDPDRLSLMLRLPLLQITGAGGAVFDLIMPRPVIETADGDLAISMERSK